MLKGHKKLQFFRNQKKYISAEAVNYGDIRDTLLVSLSCGASWTRGGRRTTLLVVAAPAAAAARGAAPPAVEIARIDRIGW